MEKDIPSLPSLPAIDFSGLDESFQDASASNFSIAALQRSLSRTPRPHPQSPSTSSSPRSSHSQHANNSVQVVDNQFGASLSLHSEDMIINDDEVMDHDDRHQPEKLWRGDVGSKLDDVGDSQSENGQSAYGDGGSPQSVDVHLADVKETDQSLRVEESYSVVRLITIQH